MANNQNTHEVAAQDAITPATNGLEAKKVVTKLYSVRDSFDLQEAHPKAMIAGCEPGLPGVPNVDPHYVFNTQRMRLLNIFWMSGNRALKVMGPPAAGKTSLIEQVHARLNVPLYMVACTPQTRAQDLIGQLLPRLDGKGLQYVPGPVMRACQEGTSVLLDEYNVMDPGEATGLNMLLEGYSWTIPETGEIIRPAKTTRFFVTQNPINGKAFVAGRNSQDQANDDRFTVLDVDYIEKEHEEKLVVRHLVAGGVDERVAATLATVTVKTANDVRTAFSNDTNGIEKAISTRAVLRWAKYACMLGGALKAEGKSHVHHALKLAVEMTPEMCAAVFQMVTANLGVDENLVSA